MKDKRKIISLLFIFMALNCFCGVSYDANGVPHSTYEPDGVTMPSEMFDNSQNNSQNNFSQSGYGSSTAEAEVQRAAEEAQRKAAEEQARIEALKIEKENAIAKTTREVLEYEDVILKSEEAVKK